MSSSAGDLVGPDRLPGDGLGGGLPDHAVQAGQVQQVGRAVQLEVQVRGLEAGDQ